MVFKSIFFSLIVTLFFSSCAIMNEPGSAADDLYFSVSSNQKNKGKIIPTIDIEKIKRDFPSQVDSTKPSGYNYNGTANTNAAAGYLAYKAQQDTIYKYNPSYSGYYQPYPMPPFSLREEYLNAKAERRQQRRLARINNRNNFNNNWGWNNGFNNGWNDWGWNNGFNNGWNNGFGWNNGWNNWGCNNFGPSLNFGWNSFNGWNTGIGFGWNNGWNNGFGWNNGWNNGFGWNNGWNNFNNPWFYNPWGYQIYNPNINDGRNVNPNPPQSRPRESVGSNMPSTNGGTIENPNPNPQRVIGRTGETTTETINQSTNQRVRSGATLIQTPNGVQYVAPRTNDAAPPTYSTYERSVSDNKVQTEFRSTNPQYVLPANQVQTPNNVIPNAAIPNQQNYQTPNNNNQQRSTNTPTYNQPAYNPPVYNAPTFNPPARSSGGSNNSGGGGGRSSGGNSGGGVSRPR